MIDKQRLFVHIYVTPICNLRCKHCYYDAKPVNSHVDYLIPIQDIANIIVNLSNLYEAYFDIEGGEFFLREDISRLFDVLPQDYWNQITVTTNGITKIDISQNVLKCLDEFRVSVEGHTDELQNEIRGINLAPVLKTCTELRAGGVPVTLRITLHKKNYKNLVTMLDHFIKLGFTKFSLYEFQATGRGLEHDIKYSLNNDDIQLIVRELLSNNFRKEGILLKLSLSAQRGLVVSSLKEEIISNDFEIIDLSGISSLTVNYDGSLGICPWKVGLEKVGQFHPENFFSDIQRFGENNSLNHECKHCSSIRIQTRSF